jgi:hypothetical protein
MNKLAIVFKMLRYRPLFYLRHPKWSLTKGIKLAKDLEDILL